MSATGQTAGQAQHQRHTRFSRERRVTAGENQPEPLVSDGVERLGPVVVVEHLSLLLLAFALVLTPDPIDGFAIGGGGQLCAGIGRYASPGHLTTAVANASAAAFGDIEVIEALGQGGEHSRPLFTVSMRDRSAEVDHPGSARNGRTSTFRLQCFDPSSASSSTRSRSGASIIQKPARYSFDSRNGPSLNTASSPRLSNHGGRIGDLRPPAKTQWPSAWSQSLNASTGSHLDRGGEAGVVVDNGNQIFHLDSSPVFGARVGDLSQTAVGEQSGPCEARKAF